MTVLEKSTTSGRPAVLPKGWKTTGWQGISLATPESWNLVGHGGDEKAGNVRLDNGETKDSSVLGVEMRWSYVKKSQSDDDLQKRLDQFFTNIRNSSKRQKITVDTKSRAIDSDNHPERSAVRSFQWKADRKGTGRIWYCNECKRLVIVQMVSGLKGDQSAVAHDVMESISCHSETDNWRAWSLYDLNTAIPADYKLKGQPQLLNIFVALTFERQLHEKIVVEQWGVANVQLRNKYLDEWYREKSSELLYGMKSEITESEAQGHPAIRVTGKMWGLTYWIGKALPQLLRFQRPAPHYAACLWECPDTNKIHQVQVFARRPCAEVVTEIVERTRCH